MSEREELLASVLRKLLTRARRYSIAHGSLWVESDIDITEAERDALRQLTQPFSVSDRPTRSGHSLEGTAVNGPIPVGQEADSE